MKKTLLTFLLLTCTSFLFSASLDRTPNKELLMVTMPKSGTHLLMKFWYLLTGQYPDSHKKCNPKHTYSWMHFYANSGKLSQNLNNPKKIVMINIRDPRDVCISVVYHHLSSKNSWLSSREKARFRRLRFDQQLMYVLHDEHPLSPLYYLSQVISIMNHPRVLVCRYENLVGPLGGGSREEQDKQILLIANSFGIDLSHAELDFLAESVYSSIETDEFNNVFRSGKIGEWKTRFTEAHKVAYKKLMGAALIHLGYEKDYQW